MLQLLHMYQAINIHTNPDITAEFHESKLLPNILDPDQPDHLPRSGI